MKFFAIFCLIILSIDGQSQFKNYSLKTPDSLVIIRGIENILVFNNPLVNKCKCGVGEDFSKKNDSAIIVICNYKTDTLLYLYSNETLIGTQIIKTQIIPDPIVLLGNYFENKLNISEILSSKQLNIILLNSLYNKKYSVFSYVVEFISKEISFKEKINGMKLSSSFYSVAKHLRRGDNIIFQNIKVTCPDCILRRLPDLYIEVK